MLSYVYFGLYILRYFYFYSLHMRAEIWRVGGGGVVKTKIGSMKRPDDGSFYEYKTS